MKFSKSLIAFLAALAMAHSGYAAEDKPAEKKKEPVKTQKAKAPEPTATPGVRKIEKKPKEDKPADAVTDKPAKPKVKRPEELKAEQEAKK
jgi:hypothetical protein